MAAPALKYPPDSPLSVGASEGQAGDIGLGGKIPSHSGFSQICCVAAAIVLGQAAFLARPAQSGVLRFPAGALVLVVIAILICSIGICLRPGPGLQRASTRMLRPLLAIGLLMEIWRLPIIGLFIEFPAGRGLLLPFVALAGVAVVLLAILFIARSSAIVTVCFLLLVTFHGLMGAWYLDLSRRPHVDAYVLQRLSCEALLDGRDPYAITFPDIYGPGSGYYRNGLVVNGQVQFGYDYPPLSLLLAMPGYLMGDLRYSHLLALSLAALLIGFVRPGRISKIAAGMMLFLPDVFHQIENSWTEPFVLLVFCAVAWCASKRWTKAAAVSLGLLLVSKQYALLVAPAGWLLMPRPVRWPAVLKYATIAVGCGTLVTLPFILWNPQAFFHSMTAPFIGVLRMDSVSFLPLIAKWSGWRPTIVWPLAASALASALVLWRGREGAVGFAAGATLILLLAFVFSTQSFANYYFLAAGILCAATAAADGVRDEFGGDSLPPPVLRARAGEGAP